MLCVGSEGFSVLYRSHLDAFLFFSRKRLSFYGGLAKASRLIPAQKTRAEHGMALL